MGWVVSCGKDFSWKCGDDEFLNRVPEEIGVGKHHYVVYTCDEDWNITWEVADPLDETVNTEDGVGEVLILSAEDREVIKRYLETEKTEWPEPLHELLTALMDYLEGKGEATIQATF